MVMRNESVIAVMGAAGHVGFSTSSALRQAGKQVRAIVRDSAKAVDLRQIGCSIALADLQDTSALVRAIDGAEAVQIIIPLSPQAQDPAADLRQSIESMVSALVQTGPKRVLAISDYGAHVTDDIGIPSLFHDLEARLRRLNGHKFILRSAEHMHNWGRSIPAALASGVLPSFQLPIDREQPTVSAQDVGLISARLLLRPDSGNDVDVIHVEGPRRYSASDVAKVLSQVASHRVHAQAVPRSLWKEALAHMPATLADLLIKTNDAKNNGKLVDIEPNANEVIYATTELMDALKPLVPLR
jgi:NAD(P)H dehydrogenase (quinone)